MKEAISDSDSEQELVRLVRSSDTDYGARKLCLDSESRRERGGTKKVDEGEQKMTKKKMSLSNEWRLMQC